MENKTVAITGLGACGPHGVSRDALWKAFLIRQALTPEEDGIARMHPDTYKEMRESDFEDKENYSRLDVLATSAAREAWDHTGMNRKIDPKVWPRVGISMCTQWGELEASENKSDDNSTVAGLACAPTDLIAREFYVHGPRHTFVGGPSDGALALGAAAEQIRCGDADLMFAGGAESPIERVCLTGSANLTPAEGAAVVILEDLQRAKSRKGLIHALVLGQGSAFGSKAIDIACSSALAHCSKTYKDVDCVITARTDGGDFAIEEMMGDSQGAISAQGMMIISMALSKGELPGHGDLGNIVMMVSVSPGAGATCLILARHERGV